MNDAQNQAPQSQEPPATEAQPELPPQESVKTRELVPLDPFTLSIRNMFSSVASRYDLANRVMSLGRDLFWRDALARRIKIVHQPGHLLDLAAGTGDQLIAAKNHWPLLELTGVDLSPVMLSLAEIKFAGLPEPRPQLLEGDAQNLPFEDNSFDSVSISFGLRNIPDRQAVYNEVLRVLKPKGRFLVLEMYHDQQSWHTPIVNFYLNKLVPMLGGRLVNHQPEAYNYLAKSIMAFPSPEKLFREMAQVGFKDISWHSYTFNTVMLVWGHKPD